MSFSLDVTRVFLEDKGERMNYESGKRKRKGAWKYEIGHFHVSTIVETSKRPQDLPSSIRRGSFLGQEPNFPSLRLRRRHELALRKQTGEENHADSAKDLTWRISFGLSSWRKDSGTAVTAMVSPTALKTSIE